MLGKDGAYARCLGNRRRGYPSNVQEYAVYPTKEGRTFDHISSLKVYENKL